MNESRADGVREARSLFQARGGGAIPTSALQLRLDVIDFEDARRMNRVWHSRLPRIGDPTCIMRASLCFGAEYDGFYYAVGIWSHPVNRSLPQDDWLELRRLAVAPNAPRNSASRCIAIMTRLIRQYRPKIKRLISYQDTEVHTGGIYRAAGWVIGKLTEFSDWSNGSRKRPKVQSEADKVRWEKVL